MSLIKPSLWHLVGKQYALKVKSYHGMFSTLVLLQLIGILFSFIGGEGYGQGMDNIWIAVTFYSANTVIAFTFLWIFVNGILITTRAYREEDFTFVTNRLSSHLANGLFILTASVIGGITSILAGFFVKVIIRYTFSENYIMAPETTLSLKVFLSGLLATMLFMTLLGMLGYLIGMLVQISSGMIFIVPVLVMGLFFFAGQTGHEDLLTRMIDFYANETSIVQLFIKVIVTVSLLFSFTAIFTNRLEVRTT